MSKEPFHDLHEKGADIALTRLISEGGSSLARSEHLCILSHICPMDPRHSAYRCTAGDCTLSSPPDNSLFSVPAGLAAELDGGLIPAVLRSRFEQRGIPLSEGTRLEAQHTDRTWLIIDGNSKYSIRRSAARLIVYRG